MDVEVGFMETRLVSQGVRWLELIPEGVIILSELFSNRTSGDFYTTPGFISLSSLTLADRRDSRDNRDECTLARNPDIS